MAGILRWDRTERRRAIAAGEMPHAIRWDSVRDARIARGNAAVPVRKKQ